MMPLGPQFTRLFGITDAQFGLLVSAYTLSAGASGLLASTYIDRFGRKRLLLTLYVLFGLATLACGLAPTYGSLMVARILAGPSAGCCRRCRRPSWPTWCRSSGAAGPWAS